MYKKLVKRIDGWLLLTIWMVMIIYCIVSCLVGCSDVRASQSSSVTYMDPALMHPNLVPIYEKGALWYDSATNNVYFWNGRGIKGLGNSEAASEYATMPTPYLDRTGKIYKYDVENNKLVPFDVYMKDH